MWPLLLEGEQQWFTDVPGTVTTARKGYASRNRAAITGSQRLILKTVVGMVWQAERLIWRGFQRINVNSGAVELKSLKSLRRKAFSQKIDGQLRFLG